MRAPDFLFIGPDKAGSSWLFELLDSHPAAWLPPAKDLYFFDREYGRGLDWYLRYFEPAPADATAVGEISHDYLFSAQAARRIAADLPGVRLLSFLRHPVDRSFSQYLYIARSGLTTAPFEEAIAQHPEILENSRYAKHLAAYLDLFPREQLKIRRFEDLEASSEAFARQILADLDLPWTEGLAYEARVRGAAAARSPALSRLMKAGAHGARALGLANLVGRIKRGPVQKLLYREYRGEERPRLSPDTRARLTEQFRPDVEALETQLGWDLSAWKTVPAGREPA